MRTSQLILIPIYWNTFTYWFFFYYHIPDRILISKVVSLDQLRACLHGCGGPQICEVTCGGSPHLSCKRDQIKMRDYMDRRVTPPERVTSPSWGSPPPCKQALIDECTACRL